VPDFKDKAEFENVHCERESAAAICVTGIEDRLTWIPKSQIDNDSEVWKPGQDGKLVISEYIAVQKGLV